MDDTLPAISSCEGALDPTLRVQHAATFLTEFERFERVFRRRKAWFQELPRRGDAFSKRMLFLSDDKLWEVFRDGASSRIQRKRLVFEWCAPFPRLHEACVNGDRAKVRSLLASPKACTLSRDSCGRIPLHHAVINEHWKLVKLLLNRRDAKIQAYCRDNSQRTPLHYVLQKMEIRTRRQRGFSGQQRLVTTEMRVGCKRYRQLWDLADRMLGFFDREMLQDESSIESAGGESIRELDLRCRGDFWDVSRSGDLERLETLVQLYGCSMKDWELRELKWTLLHEASENRHLRIVYFLLSTLEISNVAQDASGCTALHCAARRGSLGVCQLLLGRMSLEGSEQVYSDEAEAEELACCQDVRGRTALHWSLLGTQQDEVALFLAKSYPSTLQIHDEDGVTPLHLAIQRGDLELVRQFVDLGANVGNPVSATVEGGSDRPKASWAPCGLVFQRHGRSKIDTVVVPAADVTSPSDCEPRGVYREAAPRWENVQHPVETLWYWGQRSKASHTRSQVLSAPVAPPNGRPNDALDKEEALGCGKYGGVCDRCSVKPPLAMGETCQSPLVMSPLLLALRLCALTRRPASLLSCRVAIVEFLLMSGADPDGMDGNDDVADKRELELVPPRSPLAEALRGSIPCPQLLPMLLLHGAKQISLLEIWRCCSSVPAADAAAMETALRHLLELEDVNDREFSALLFYHKYFRVFLEFITKMETLNAQDAAGQGHWPRISPWKGIHESLTSRSSSRMKITRGRQVELEHLKFLSELLQSGQDGAVEAVGADVWSLFEYVVDRYLDQWASSSAPSVVERRKMTVRTLDEREQVLLLCFRQLLAHIKQEGGHKETADSKLTVWLGQAIVLGCFQCALVLLETQVRWSYGRPSLGVVLAHYTTARARRSNRGDRELRYHHEFLSICVEQLLTPISQQVQASRSPVNVVVSLRSVLYLCAYNLPFPLVERCLSLVLPANSSDGSEPDQLRVDGKTLEQWLIQHERCDIMQLLLTNLPVGTERGSYWSRLVAAACGRRESCLLDQLFALYAELVANHLGIDERITLLTCLVLKVAIPRDCVALMTRLMDLLTREDSVDEGAKQGTDFLHAIAGWNAVRVAEFCSKEDDSSNCEQVPSASRRHWRHLVLQEMETRHELDGCTPQELCQLLGHNHLHYLLSTHHKTTIEEEEYAQVSKSLFVTEKDASDRENEPSKQQFGLFRSVMALNEHSQPQSTGNLLASTLKSTPYRQIPSSFNPWETAIALNQVSHLQAMALLDRSQASPSHSVLTAIKYGSMDALRWLLASNDLITTLISESEGTQCLQAAARFPGDLYAEMTRLLLKTGLNPGRLAGDGLDVSLLHRAACFSNPELACEVMNLLLERSDCDVNVLDAFGNTAVTYAIASGRLSNVCFLIKRFNCRLEAEYEGQASFYYVLNLVPSYSWRLIVRELLKLKRNRAFLHCEMDSKTCGCKGFEAGEASEECAFCGHESSSHNLLPLPSWLRDQYDTYLSRSSAPPRGDIGSDDEGDDRRLIRSDEVAEDEETALENRCGRLDVELLQRITVIRYSHVFQMNDLSSPAPGEVPASSESGEQREEAISIQSEGGSCWSQPQIDADSIEHTQPIDYDSLDEMEDESRDGADQELSSCAWALRQELGMIHSSTCLCQATAFATSAARLTHLVVCRWLKRTALSQEHGLVASPSLQGAFHHWSRFKQTTTAPLVALADRHDAAASPPNALKSAVTQWRYAREFSAFQRLKTHRKSAEVTHHSLATRLDQLTAETRRHRFLALQRRQQQLHEATRGFQPA
ncbi:hypothetical protein BBJ28_00008379 [Nothophytophthora sp. Chile5]|nr:hypothetical protein BBJ28_00008379 [Nothophytophthora sp. Chile5]